MKTFLFFLASAVVLSGCGPGGRALSKGGSGSTETIEVEGVKDYRLAQPASYRNISVIPVLSTKKPDPNEQDYMSLEEAKKNDWVEIVEKPGSEEVNELQVRNKGPRPLLLLAGQLLVGGKQDRIVGKDTVVPAGETVLVPVYCVEHGRWSGSSEKFEYRDMQVPARVKESAMYAHQEEVWAKVSEYNKSAAAAPGMSTIQAGLDSEEVRKSIEEGLARLTSGLQGENVVGLIYCVDGKVVSMELFGSPKLFASSRDGLLRGMIADAAVAGGSEKSPDLDAAKRFLARAVNAPRSLAAGNGGEAARRRVDSSLLGFSQDGIRGQEVTAAPADSAASSPTERQLVHGNYMNNE
jgi:hypothetical protein